MSLSYQEFLKAKVRMAPTTGTRCTHKDVNPLLFPHQRDIVVWAVNGGQRAIFAAFGIGKTPIQIEIMRILMLDPKRKRSLIVMPLGVRQEFTRDAAMLGVSVTFVRHTEEAGETGLYMTNYEAVREGNVDPRAFDACSLDEASILRGLGGTKTFRKFMQLFEHTDTLRFVATATPSPNDFIELLSYAAFLGIMDVGQAKTRFFRRNSEKADKLTLHPHKEREFWLWVSSWAIFVQKPSDLGYSDEGYDMPPIEVRWHEVATNHADASQTKWGQGRLLKNSAIGVQDAAREKRSSLGARLNKMMELRALDPDAHRILWHDLEDERKAIEAAIPDAVSVYGSQDLDRREEAIIDFSEGRIRELAAKPVIAGSGCNFQRHCSWAIFLGIGFKFNDFIQAIHRIQRFLQTKPVRIDLIYSEAEAEVRATLERKWAQHEELVANMTQIIRKYGLSEAAIAGELARSLGVARQEESGENWKLVNNDSVEECAAMPSDSVGMIVTSIPFSTQYEYTPSYNDFGHTDDNEHFWQQMDFLTPELYRVLSPGRVAAIHVKDRITPGGINGFGFQTVQPFSDECVAHFIKHGFAFLARKTIVTDVVRENAQTYRLGWTEQCKDGSRMGCGMPEYVLLFRKPPTDRSNGYADLPVVKSKEDYPRARWQLDAHGFSRSSGNRLLTKADLQGLKHDQIFKLFRQHSMDHIYDFENHVQAGEWLHERGMLPPTFMLIPPQSWHPDVWTDITRMRTLNSAQSSAGREMHLCPMQFDTADRLITQFTNPGEVVFDPFAGIGTVPLRALLLGRDGLGCELNSQYFADSVYYLREAAAARSIPSLFDLEELELLEDAVA